MNLPPSGEGSYAKQILLLLAIVATLARAWTTYHSPLNVATATEVLASRAIDLVTVATLAGAWNFIRPLASENSYACLQQEAFFLADVGQLITHGAF